jgi:hypothetical protein
MTSDASPPDPDDYFGECLKCGAYLTEGESYYRGLCLHCREAIAVMLDLEAGDKLEAGEVVTA